MDRSFRGCFTAVMVRGEWSRCQSLGYSGSTKGPVTVAGVGLKSVLFLCAGLGGGGRAGVAGAAGGHIGGEFLEAVVLGVGCA